MTDIVERLRDMRLLERRNIAGDAADEITRLRAENEALRAERDKYRDTLLSRHGGEPLALLDELDEARVEVETLRSALRALAVSELGGYCTMCESHWIVRGPERHRAQCLAAPKEGER